jgi:hypothetical protein
MIRSSRFCGALAMTTPTTSVVLGLAGDEVGERVAP